MPSLNPGSPKRLSFRADPGFSCHTDLRPRITLESYDSKVATFKFLVDENDCNLMGTLHGGAIFSLAGDLSHLPVFVEAPESQPGTTITLEVDYLSSPKPGETIIIQTQVDSIDGKFSVSLAIFYNEKVRWIPLV